MKKRTWKRPQDIIYYTTSDPKKIKGKYLPHNVCKKWTEDFLDEDTGEVVSIERSQLIVERGYISDDKLLQLTFALQAGDIAEVEICDDDVSDMSIYTHSYLTAYKVELFFGNNIKQLFACYAQSIQQAIQIATEFGNVYRGVEGSVDIIKVIPAKAQFVPDDDMCIPEDERIPAEERKDYFKVQVRTICEDEFNTEVFKTEYVINAEEAGQARERIARMLDIMEAKRKEEMGKNYKPCDRSIRRVVPFKVDCVVPREYSELYREAQS